MNQHTLKQTYSFNGKGLHTGKVVNLRLCPAPVDTGIVFVRTDLGGARIPAIASNVSSTRRSTQLGAGAAKVGTVEHVLSALTGLGVDNALVELDGPEVPILDGSARLYVEAVLRDGTLDQGAARKWVTISKEIEVRNEKSGSWIKISPAQEPSIELTIDFGSDVIGVQKVSYTKDVSYSSQIASCRTFCFLHEILPQLALGLIKGGDLDNAILVVEKPVSKFALRFVARLLGKQAPQVSQKGFLAEGGLRFADECGRHKLLDLIGDLRLCGGMPCLRVEAYKPGHALNTAAAREILKNI